MTDQQVNELYEHLSSLLREVDLTDFHIIASEFAALEAPRNRAVFLRLYLERLINELSMYGSRNVQGILTRLNEVVYTENSKQISLIELDLSEADAEAIKERTINISQGVEFGSLIGAFREILNDLRLDQNQNLGL